MTENAILVFFFLKSSLRLHCPVVDDDDALVIIPSAFSYNVLSFILLLLSGYFI